MSALHDRIRGYRTMVALLGDAAEEHAHVLEASARIDRNPSSADAVAQLALIGRDVRAIGWKRGAAELQLEELESAIRASGDQTEYSRLVDLRDIAEATRALLAGLEEEARELLNRATRRLQ